MKIMQSISNQMLQWLGKREETNASKSERNAEAIITTLAFSKLTLQNKILCVGKLIQHYGSGDGYTPNSLERTLLALNRELNSQINENWAGAYSEGLTAIA
jgi:hypothetical protein